LHQELVLLSDVLGLASLVELMEQGDPAGETVCKVLGPA
jgi:hypothetical protein